MTAQRKPRPIGPRAVVEEETPPSATEGDAEQFDLGTVTRYISSLTAGQKMALDEASGGAVSQLMAGEPPRSPLTFMAALAWIVRRKRGDRLTWRQVEAFDDEQLGALLGELTEVTSGPKSASSEPDTSA